MAAAAGSGSDPFAVKMHKLLKDARGFDSFKEKQLDSLRSQLVEERDVLLCTPTGSGKSVVFQLLGLAAAKGTVVVVVPTLELQANHLAELAPILIKFKLSATALGSLNEADSKQDGKALNGLQNRWVFITPEHAVTVEKHLQRLAKKKLLISVVYDECHLATDLGWASFRDAYIKLGRVLQSLACPKLAMTATAPTKVVQTITERCGLRDSVIHRGNVARKHLYYKVHPQTEIEEDLAFLKDHIQRGTRVLIFCPTRNDTALVYDFFMLAYPELCLAKQVEVLHSEISLLKRRSVFAGWREAKIQVLINTSLLSNGVNVDDVQLIVHYGSPRSFLQYIQETGRGGRGVQELLCECRLFIKPGQAFPRVDPRKRLSVRQQSYDAINLHDMNAFIATRCCRRRYIEWYLSGSHDDLAAGQLLPADCDNCKYSQDDAASQTDLNHAYLVSAILETIRSTGGRLNLIGVASVLKDRKIKPACAAFITSKRECETFGCCHRGSGNKEARKYKRNDIVWFGFALLSIRPALLEDPRPDFALPGGLALTRDGIDLLKELAFSPVESSFNGTYRIIKPAVLVKSEAKTDRLNSGSAEALETAPERSHLLVSAVRHFTVPLAHELGVPVAMVLPEMAVERLALTNSGILKTPDDLKQIPGAFGPVFDDNEVGKRWPTFARDILDVLQSDGDDLRFLSQWAQEDFDPPARKEGESLPPAAFSFVAAPAPVSKPKHNLDPDFEPSGFRARAEKKANAFALAQLSTGPGQRSPFVELSQPAARAGSKRASAMLGLALMSVWDEKSPPKKPAHSVTLHDLLQRPAKAAKVDDVQAVIFQEVLESCSGDALKFQRALFSQRRKPAKSTGLSESKRLEANLKSVHRFAKECGGDGMCAYLSFADNIQFRVNPHRLPAFCDGKVPSAQSVKRAALEWLGAQPRKVVIDIYVPVLEGENRAVRVPAALKSHDEAKWLAGWKKYVSSIYGHSTQFADELILMALAESFSCSIMVFSSAGCSFDRIFKPSRSAAASRFTVELGHILERHYKSVYVNH